MELLSVQKSAQEVAEAISAVLDVDVTIVDRDFKRVASTGEYKNFIGERLPKNCSFERIFKTKKAQFIDRPNKSEKCLDCRSRGNCNELATIGYPIRNNGDLLGVIGLIAFTEDQRHRIEREYESLLVFLRKLSDLLAGNLKYTETIKALKIQDLETKAIINGLQSAIVCVDEKSRIKFVNERALDYLSSSEAELINKNLEDILKGYEYKKDLRETREIKIRGKSYLLDYSPVFADGKLVSGIFEISKTSNLIKNIYKIIGSEKLINFEDILGESQEFTRVKKLSKNLAKSKSTILLRGESGTGKELFARAIYSESKRQREPFVVVNCASIPDNLLESELFGYEGGSFTGAKKEGNMGKFELANGGTLFLDEIGDLPLHLQPKLLRVLQDGSFSRIGGNEIINADFRLISATNRKLEEMIARGEFREDLYYRLNVIPITIPALRERRQDVELLAEAFLEKYCRILGKNMEFSPRAMEAMKNYSWPGNVRELQNVVEYLVNVTNDSRIDLDKLPDKLLEEKLERPVLDSSLKEMLDSYEEEILSRYLEIYGKKTEDKKLVAEKLNIDLSTLYRKLGKYNLQ